jgi:hypothetical protein
MTVSNERNHNGGDREASSIRARRAVMKRLIIFATAVLVVISSGVLYSGKMSLYQVVELFICEQEVVLAEMLAKVSVSRQELVTVSYCTCEGVDPSLKKFVKKTKCDPPKDLVYDCTCIGKTHY